MPDISGKKILLIIPSYDIGGAERQASFLAKFLKENGAAVHVLSVDGKAEGPLSGWFNGLDIPQATYPVNLYYFNKYSGLRPTPSNIRFLKILFRQISQLKGIVKKISPDVVIPFCYAPNIVAGILPGKVYRIWNQRDCGFPPLNNGHFEKKALARANDIVANSNAGADYLEKTAGIALKKITVIANAVVPLQAQKSRDEYRKELAVKENEILITMLANFSTHKDQTSAVKALGLITGDTQAKLLLIGRFDGTENSIKGLVETLGITDRVLIRPFSNDPAGVYAASDIAVHSSYGEGMSNSLAEAMACGLPVVASDIEGHTCLLGKKNEFLFEAGNANDLAQKLQQLINNPAKRKESGGRNKQIAETDFSIKTNGENYIRLFAN